MGARAVRRICVLGVAVAALAGCGSGSKSGTATSTTTTTSGVPTVTEDASLAAQVPTAIRQAGTIKVSTHSPFPPGELSSTLGLDPELMRAIAGVLGVKAVFVDEAFEKILPHVENGQNNVGAASVTDTKGREKTVQMVTYLLPGEAFLTKSSGPNITKLAEICGHKISTLQHTVELEHVLEQANRCKHEGKPKIRVSVFQELESQAIPALLDGQTEILYADSPALEYQKQKLGDQVSLSPVSNREPYGFVLNQESGLAQPMVEALKVLKANGTYAAILKRWHVQNDALSEPVIDGAIH